MKHKITRPENRLLLINGVYSLLLTAAAVLLLGGYEPHFLYKGQELSLFLPTRMFFYQHMHSPGGMLTYAGTFLTQFLYYPWLGTLILILLLWAIQQGIQRIYSFPPALQLLSFFPSAALLAGITQLGYVIYTLKSPGILFSQIVGFLFTLMLFGIYRKIKNDPAKIGWSILSLTLSYPLFGFYTVLAGLLMTVSSLLPAGHHRRSYGPAAVALASTLIPPVVYYHFYTTVNILNIYRIGLPAFEINSHEFILWVPYLMLIAAPFLFLFCFRNPSSPHPGKQAVWIASGLFVGLLLFVYLLTFRQPTFFTELSMNRAIEKRDWKEVLRLAKNTGHEPTRLIVMNKNLALWKLGQCGDRMFTFPDGGVKPRCSRHVMLMQTGGKTLYFHYGKLNYCYRWCMEDGVEYGWKTEYLKYMALCTLFTGEYNLAEKYLNTLEQTLFHKKWARKYKACLRNPDALVKDPDFKQIRPLYGYPNVLDGDSGLVEIYLINTLASLTKGTKETTELSLIANLILKGIQPFWPRFFLYAHLHDRIPVHYQEAAMLYAYLAQKPEMVKGIRFDQRVTDRFKEFQQMSIVYQHVPENQSAPLFQEKFGDTFWYYYFFVNDIKSY